MPGSSDVATVPFEQHRRQVIVGVDQQGLVEDGLGAGEDLQLALGSVIRTMGVKEFAAKVRMASPNVLRAINPRHNPTQETLNRLLKPFKLRLSLAPLTGKPRRTAA